MKQPAQMRGATMEKDSTKGLSNVIRIDDERIQEREARRYAP